MFLDILICSLHHFLEFVEHLCHFFFWPHCESCEILVPRLGIELVTLHWKHTILTTGPLGKSLHHFLIKTLFRKVILLHFFRISFWDLFCTLFEPFFLLLCVFHDFMFRFINLKK